MNKKPDIVSLKWVLGLMKNQADAAEEALVEYGNDPSRKQALLRCMWAVHQVTSTLKALGMRKAELLTLEMERSLNYLYKDKLPAERAKLAMGGVMQGLKLIPAYLEHTESERLDTGRGLERYVNDMRRWIGEKPRPPAIFFHIDIDPVAGITAGAAPATDDEVIERANVMLAPYLEMAKQGLKRRNTAQSMKTVARIARKMQQLFRGTPVERFWFAMIGLCEGMAGGLIAPDECIAQVFKAGAFSIKYARENGAAVDETIDYDSYLLQMLYYAAACPASPVHISAVRQAFGLHENTIDEANRGLVHTDAIEIALGSANELLTDLIEFLQNNQLLEIARQAPQERDTRPLDDIEAAQARLLAAGQLEHADSLVRVQDQLRRFYGDNSQVALERLPATAGALTQGIVVVQRDLEHKLRHGVNSKYTGEQLELKESVASATFRQMGLVENGLHQILRSKALRGALSERPTDAMGVLTLTTALQRFLNKSDQGHEALRDLICEADNGVADVDQLYSLGQEYFASLDITSEDIVLRDAVDTLEEIAGALAFSGMEAEAAVMDGCREWLAAAAEAGCVQEDEAFRCFADAFAHIEMHLQRSLLDPLDDTTHMMAIAQQRAEQLREWIGRLSVGDSAAPVATLSLPTELNGGAPAAETAPAPRAEVQDDDISPEFREVFMEESEEIVEELGRLLPSWTAEPVAGDTLREMRRHFHTFKGNGRAVGANVLGELGWAVQDMMDGMLEGELAIAPELVALVQEVITALPQLLEAYCATEDADLSRVRQLTENCFAAARGEPVAAQHAVNGSASGEANNDNVASIAPAANSDEVVVPMPTTEPLAH